jgi:hypothetical protein
VLDAEPLQFSLVLLQFGYGGVAIHARTITQLPHGLS